MGPPEVSAISFKLKLKFFIWFPVARLKSGSCPDWKRFQLIPSSGTRYLVHHSLISPGDSNWSRCIFLSTDYVPEPCRSFPPCRCAPGASRDDLGACPPAPRLYQNLLFQALRGSESQARRSSRNVSLGVIHSFSPYNHPMREGPFLPKRTLRDREAPMDSGVYKEAAKGSHPGHWPQGSVPERRCNHSGAASGDHGKGGEILIGAGSAPVAARLSWTLREEEALMSRGACLLHPQSAAPFGPSLPSTSGEALALCSGFKERCGIHPPHPAGSPRGSGEILAGTQELVSSTCLL